MVKLIMVENINRLILQFLNWLIIKYKLSVATQEIGDESRASQDGRDATRPSHKTVDSQKVCISCGDMRL